MGWVDDMMAQEKRAAVGGTGVEFYVNAFMAGLVSVWKTSPFEPEIPQLAQARAAVVMLKRDATYTAFARSLIYHYLQGEWKTGDENSVLDLQRHQLPISFPFEDVLSQTYSHYRTPPKRTFGDAKNKALNEKASDLYRQARANTTAARALYEAGVTSAPIVRFLFRGGRPTLDVISADLYRASRDEKTGALLSVVYPVTVRREGGDEVQLIEWTPTERITRKAGNWKRVISREPNSYGILPFAFLNLRPNETPYGECDWDLVEETMKAARVEHTTNVDVGNAFGMTLALNLGTPKAPNVPTIGPGRIIYKDGVLNDPEGELPPTIESIQSGGQFTAMDDLRTRRLDEHKKDRGMPDRAEGAVSGFAKYLERLPLTELRQGYNDQIAEYESDLWPIVARVANIDAPGLYRFSDADMRAPVSIDFADERIIMTPQEELAHDKEKLASGLLSVEEFVRKHGQVDQAITLEEAIEAIQTNMTNYRRAYATNDDGRGEPSTAANANGGTVEGDEGAGRSVSGSLPTDVRKDEGTGTTGGEA
jgi:hypothetical protein